MVRIVPGCGIAQAAQMERELFEIAVDRVYRCMAERASGFPTLLVAMEQTVPRNVLLDAVALWGDRQPYARPQGATALPYGYWSDLLLFPIRELDGKPQFTVWKDGIFCITIPLITVERRIMGVIGEKQTVICGCLERELQDGLMDMQEALQGERRVYTQTDFHHNRFCYEAICRAQEGKAQTGSETGAVFASL